MFKPLSLFLGMRYVRSRHGNGFSSFISASSTIGIGLGVMVLIIVLSAMNGFERELANRLLSIVPHAELIAVEKPIRNWPKQIQEIQHNSHVVAAAPVIKLTGMMQKGSELKGVEIRGVDARFESLVSNLDEYIQVGSLQALGQKNNVILGAGIANKLDVTVGDQLQMLLPKPNANKNIKNRFPALMKKNVTVVGVFKFGGTIDDSLVYTSLAYASDIMGYSEGEVQGIRIRVNDVFQAPQIISQIASNFNTYVYIYNWTRTQGHVFNDIQLVKMVMLVVLVLVIAVASFNIVSTLIMAVNDKKGDIAILKTMGASRALIMITFIIQGLVNGVLGCFIGALLGSYISANLTSIVLAVESFLNVKVLSADVYFIDFIPSMLNQQDVIATVIIALIMSLIATVYPAWRATKVEPARVLGQI